MSNKIKLNKYKKNKDSEISELKVKKYNLENNKRNWTKEKILKIIKEFAVSNKKAEYIFDIQINQIIKEFAVSNKKAEYIFYKFLKITKTNKNISTCPICKTETWSKFSVDFNGNEKYFIIICHNFCLPICIGVMNIFEKPIIVKTELDKKYLNLLVTHIQDIKELSINKEKQIKFIIDILSDYFLINKKHFKDLDIETKETLPNRDIEFKFKNKIINFEVFSTFDKNIEYDVVKNIKTNIEIKLNKYKKNNINEKINFIILDIRDLLQKEFSIADEKYVFNKIFFNDLFKKKDQVFKEIKNYINKKNKINQALYITNRFTNTKTKNQIEIFQFKNNNFEKDLLLFELSYWNENLTFNYLTKNFKIINWIIQNNIPYKFIDYKLFINNYYWNYYWNYYLFNY